VRHKCDNRLCCNPNHLELGTHADNVKDAVERNRNVKREKHGCAKLTEQQAKEIKLKLEHYERGMIMKLAKEYNVGRTTIQQIKYGKRWA